MPEASSRTCELCGHVEEGPQAALRMGQHKKRAHGIAGSSPTTAKRQRRRERGGRDQAPRQKTERRGPSLRSDTRRVFQVVGQMVGVLDPYCGKVLQERSSDFANALADLAATDPRIERWLRSLGTGSRYGALIVAAGQIAIPIGAHHGFVAPELAVLSGAEPPPTVRIAHDEPPEPHARTPISDNGGLTAPGPQVIVPPSET
jgi:hypothetical protein